MFGLGVLSTLLAVGVVVLVMILKDVKDRLKVVERKLNDTKAQLRYVKDHSSYRAYAEMKESNDIASETIDDLKKWGFQYKNAYDDLNNRFDDLSNRFDTIYDESVDFDLFLEFGPYGDIRNEYTLFVVNSVRASNGEGNITMEQFEEVNYDINRAIDIDLGDRMW
jgi:hypothetical protein